jgi:hypothetical protein
MIGFGRLQIMVYLKRLTSSVASDSISMALDGSGGPADGNKTITLLSKWESILFFLIFKEDVRWGCHSNKVNRIL